MSCFNSGLKLRTRPKQFVRKNHDRIRTHRIALEWLRVRLIRSRTVFVKLDGESTVSANAGAAVQADKGRKRLHLNDGPATR